MVVMYLTTVFMFCVVVPLGYYLNLVIELKECTVTKDDSQLFALTFLAAISAMFTGAFWLMLICYACDSDDSEREKPYRQKEREEN